MTTRTIPIQCPQGANPTGNDPSPMNTMGALEDMIDYWGLDEVLMFIREICYDKANHIAVDLQDVAGAKLWVAYAVRINSVVQSIK